MGKDTLRLTRGNAELALRVPLVLVPVLSNRAVLAVGAGQLDNDYGELCRYRVCEEGASTGPCSFGHGLLVPLRRTSPPALPSQLPLFISQIAHRNNNNRTTHISTDQATKLDSPEAIVLVTCAC